MSSNNRRERELARKKRERQMARAQQSRRSNTLVIGVVGVLVAVFGGWFLLSGSGKGAADASGSPSASPTASSWCQPAPAANPNPKQFAKPTLGQISGDYTWTLTTNCGDITIDMFGDKAPVTVGSFKFLTEQKWFNGVPCHRLTTEGLWVLQCGDATGTGSGGPGYTIPDENLPASGPNNYPAGTIAMANAGANTGGSQFFIVYKDTQLGPDYTIFGKVTSGLDIVEKVAADGVQGGGADGAPAQPIGILSATITKGAN